MSTLFRKEALEHQGHRLEGEVVVRSPKTALWLTLLLGAVVVVTAYFLFNYSYARKESVPGYIVSSQGLARVIAPRAGTIAEIHVDEGDTIAADAPLLLIDHDRASTDGVGGTGKALLALAQRRTAIEAQIVSERDALGNLIAAQHAHVETLSEQIEHLRQQLAYQAKLVALAKLDFDQLGTLKQQGAASAQALRDRRRSWVQAQLKEAELAREIAAIQSEIERRKQDQIAAHISTERAISQLQDEQQDIAERSALLQSEQQTLISAPLAGRVAALHVALGQDIEGGRSPLSILPRGGELMAELYVPTRAAGFIRSGQEVRLLYDAFPYQRFGTYRGVVERITNSIVTPQDAPGPMRLDEPAYRVRVKLDKDTVTADTGEIPLRSGMLLRANIILERQRLVDWVVTPLLARLRGAQ